MVSSMVNSMVEKYGNLYVSMEVNADLLYVSLVVNAG